MFDAIKKGFEYLYNLLITLFDWILDGILAILKPMFDLIYAIGYFFYKIGVLAVELLQLLGSVGKLGLGLMQGVLKTITGFSYQGTAAAVPGSFADTFAQLQPIFTALQFNKIGYVLIFSIWFFTALAALKMINSLRGAT